MLLVFEQNFVRPAKRVSDVQTFRLRRCLKGGTPPANLAREHSRSDTCARRSQEVSSVRLNPGLTKRLHREQRAFREMTEALCRARRRNHQVISGNSSVYSNDAYEMIEDEDTFTEAPWRQEPTGQTLFELVIWRYRSFQNARLSRKE